jgi:hypothetical protein
VAARVPTSSAEINRVLEIPGTDRSPDMHLALLLQSFVGTGI